MNRKLRKNISVLLSGTALTIAAGSASAISVTDLGGLPSQPGNLEASGTVPIYAWDGHNSPFPGAADCGWAHNSKWYTVKVPVNVVVQFTMTSPVPGMNPAFSVFKTNGKFDGADHLSHHYNQVGLTGSSSFLKPSGSPKNGATEFVGYANSGIQPFTNCDGKTVKKGSASFSFVAPGTAALSKTLTPGLYLIAVGGSCWADAIDDFPCGPAAPAAFKLDIRKAPIVPLPHDHEPPPVCEQSVGGPDDCEPPPPPPEPTAG